MKCDFCDKELINNTCLKCSLLYFKDRTVQQRHCWNFEEYKKYLSKNHDTKKY